LRVGQYRGLTVEPHQQIAGFVANNDEAVFFEHSPRPLIRLRERSIERSDCDRREELRNSF